MPQNRTNALPPPYTPSNPPNQSFRRGTNITRPTPRPRRAGIQRAARAYASVAASSTTRTMGAAAHCPRLSDASRANLQLLMQNTCNRSLETSVSGVVGEEKPSERVCSCRSVDVSARMGVQAAANQPLKRGGFEAGVWECVWAFLWRFLLWHWALIESDGFYCFSLTGDRCRVRRRCGTRMFAECGNLVFLSFPLRRACFSNIDMTWITLKMRKV